jgi:hypothetical protein
VPAERERDDVVDFQLRGRVRHAFESWTHVARARRQARSKRLLKKVAFERVVADVVVNRRPIVSFRERD